MASRSDNDAVEDLVRQYLREIGAHPLLTASDEVVLALAIRAGSDAAAVLQGSAAETLTDARRDELEAAVAMGIEAKRQFIVSNLRLVVSIAKRYRSAGLPLLDLVQEGNLGLIRAVEKFDADRGCKFSTYATWWIRQAIGRAIADKGRSIRLPIHVAELAGRVRRTSALLAERLGREPTAAEIAAACEVPLQTIVDLERVMPDTISLQSAVAGDGGDGELADFLPDENAPVPYDLAIAAVEGEEIMAAVATLSEREQDVLRLRFGLAGADTHTLEEVGRAFRLTRERIRQIEAKALAKLRHPATPSNRRQLVELEDTRRDRGRPSRAPGGAAAAAGDQAVNWA